MQPLVTPRALTGLLKKRVGRIPSRAVFIYSERTLAPLLIDRLDLVVHDDLTKYLLNPKRIYVRKKGNLLVSSLPAGAPITAAVAEELGALGVEEFLLLGTAGGLSPKLSMGDLVLCTRAVRDEGTSHHYLGPSRFSTPDPGLTKRIHGIIEQLGFKFRSGPTWTIDAPYMETRQEVVHYRNAGIYTVEMEASALFAVAKKRGYRAAAVFAVSDLLGGMGWSGFATNLGPSYSRLALIAESFAESRAT
jgi:nucleoside phosphorylase